MLVGPIVTDADRRWALAKCPRWVRLTVDDGALPEIVDDGAPLDVAGNARTLSPPCWADFVAAEVERFERYFAGRRKSYPEWSKLWRTAWWPRTDARRRFPKSAPSEPQPFFGVGTPEFDRAMQVATAAERGVWKRFGAQLLQGDKRLGFVMGKGRSMIDPGSVRIRVRDVQDAAAAVFAIPRAALGTGYGPYVRERQLAMALAVELTDKSLVDIAAVFGCDHTTIRHASIRVRGRLRDDPALRAKADRIRTEAAISAARFIETMRRAALPQANQGRSA